MNLFTLSLQEGAFRTFSKNCSLTFTASLVTPKHSKDRQPCLLHSFQSWLSGAVVNTPFHNMITPRLWKHQAVFKITFKTYFFKTTITSITVWRGRPGQTLVHLRGPTVEATGRTMVTTDQHFQHHWHLTAQPRLECLLCGSFSSSCRSLGLIFSQCHWCKSCSCS